MLLALLEAVGCNKRGESTGGTDDDGAAVTEAERVSDEARCLGSESFDANCIWYARAAASSSGLSGVEAFGLAEEDSGEGVRDRGPGGIRCCRRVWRMEVYKSSCSVVPIFP